MFKALFCATDKSEEWERNDAAFRTDKVVAIKNMSLINAHRDVGRRGKKKWQQQKER